MTAVRLARAYTHRDVIIKIDGQFNGGNDYIVFNQLAANCDETNAGGRASHLKPFTAGVPRAIEQTLRVVPWNDLPALEATWDEVGDDVAAVLMVPIDYNNGCLVPEPGYLEAVRKMTKTRDCLLIWDEVLSGLKTGIGSAPEKFGVVPDILTFSKALSNGVPFAVIAGNADVMAMLAKPLPAGALQGGTYAGNAIGAAAANATLDILSEPDFYPRLLGNTNRFLTELQAVFDRSPVPARVQWLGCGFGIYVGTREPVHNASDVQRLDRAMARTYFLRCIDRGVYYHTDFTVSAAHSTPVLDDVLQRMADAAAQPV